MYTRSSTTGRTKRGEVPAEEQQVGGRQEGNDSEGEEADEMSPHQGDDPDTRYDQEGAEDEEGTDSDASSVGSGGFNSFGLDLTDFIDLSDRSFCRVVMSRKDSLTKRRAPCVCGNLIATCNRRGHGTKRAEEQNRGTPGFYPMMTGRGGTVDGRLDKGPPIPTTEFAKLKRLEEEEVERASSRLRASMDREDDEEEDFPTAPDEEDEESQSEHRGVGWTDKGRGKGSKIQFDLDETTTPPRFGRTPIGPSRDPRPHSPSSIKRQGPPPNFEKSTPRPWFGLTTLEGQRVICQSVEDMMDLQEEGAEYECTLPSKGAAEIWLDAAPPEAPKRVWYGLIETSGTKVVCCEQDDLNFFLEAGAKLKKTFPTEPLADQWLDERTPLPPPRTTIKRAPSHIPASRPDSTDPLRPRGSHQAKIRQTGSPDPDHISPTYHPVTPPRPRGGLASAMGIDPSTGDKKKIYDLVMADTEAMDEALCPPGLAYEDRECLFEQVIDVGALPGTYRRGDSEGEAGVSADMQMFATVAMRSWGGRGKGNGNASNLTWASATKNSLDKIKGLEDIERMISKIAGIRERLFAGQEQRLARFLHRRRYVQDDIDAYLENGLLPLLVIRTFRSYSELLSTARLEAYQCTTGWTGSLAKAMIEHHAEKLGDIRAYAADWRDCLLETYVHLRDAEKNKFFSESMTRALWRQARPPLMSPITDAEDGEGQRGATGGGDAEGRCSHCRRRSVHDGTTKSKCPLKNFSGTAARALVKSFSDEKAKQVITAAVAAMAQDKDADPNAIVKSVRGLHGKTD